MFVRAILNCELGKFDVTMECPQSYNILNLGKVILLWLGGSVKGAMHSARSLQLLGISHDGWLHEVLLLH